MGPDRQSLLRILRSTWGYDGFRPLQEEAMMAVLRGEDSLVILPTGGGKSLCFQAPALLMPGTAIVVSPLISLMKDQVDALHELGVPAGKLHSGQNSDESREVFFALREGRLKLLYVSPERLLLEGFDKITKGAEVSFLAVDEGHCISEWGHDFRPEYRQLKGFREAFPRAALHAYTATATPQVARDISNQLGQKKPRVLVGSFDRTNLFYRCERRTDPVEQVATIARRHKNESGIVYCITRKETESIAADLARHKIKALPYHAGLDEEVRARNQDAFINDDVRLIVATIAFGMGIDKPDVRFVVHAGMPKSLENYQQESGRAGRDGLAAECVLLHSVQDLMKWKYIIKDQPPAIQRISNEKMRGVEGYCMSFACRRRALLRYFGEDWPHENCGFCDVCASAPTVTPESLVVAQKILSCVKRLGESQPSDYVGRVLLGDPEEAIRAAGHDGLSTFGLMRGTPRETVRGWIEQLLAQGYLRQDGLRTGPLSVTARGWEAIRGEREPRLVQRNPRTADEIPAAAAHADDEWAGVDRDLFEELRQLRSRLAKERGILPYHVFGDKTLRTLASEKPTSAVALRKVHGVGKEKFSQYGRAFLDAIIAHVRANGGTVSAAPERSDKANSGANAVRETALRLLAQGHTPEQVSAQTGRAVSTVEGYLVELVAEDRMTDPTRWVAEEEANRIRAARDAVAPDLLGRLKPLSEALGGDIPYWKIRVVLACDRNRERAGSSPTP
jgi:ATP-dependent DNA helicase RecQ